MKTRYFVVNLSDGDYTSYDKEEKAIEVAKHLHLSGDEFAVFKGEMLTYVPPTSNGSFHSS